MKKFHLSVLEFCSELLFCEMVNSASTGGIKKMGWNEVDLSLLTLLQDVP